MQTINSQGLRLASFEGARLIDNLALLIIRCFDMINLATSGFF